MPTPEEISLPGVLYALSDPTRLAIVKSIAEEGEKACGTFDLNLPKSTMSHHFKVLREEGVVFTKITGTSFINALRRDELETLFPGLLDAVLSACESAPQATALIS